MQHDASPFPVAENPSSFETMDARACEKVTLYADTVGTLDEEVDGRKENFSVHLAISTCPRHHYMTSLLRKNVSVLQYSLLHTMLRPTLWVRDPRLPDQRPLPLSPLGALRVKTQRCSNAETESSAGTASQGISS